jgi:hypothetical protein
MIDNRDAIVTGIKESTVIGELAIDHPAQMVVVIHSTTINLPFVALAQKWPSTEKSHDRKES